MDINIKDIIDLNDIANEAKKSLDEKLKRIANILIEDDLLYYTKGSTLDPIDCKETESYLVIRFFVHHPYNMRSSFSIYIPLSYNNIKDYFKYLKEEYKETRLIRQQLMYPKELVTKK